MVLQKADSYCSTFNRLLDVRVLKGNNTTLGLACKAQRELVINLIKIPSFLLLWVVACWPSLTSKIQFCLSYYVLLVL
jgi:hypothetical protein